MNHDKWRESEGSLTGHHGVQCFMFASQYVVFTSQLHKVVVEGAQHRSGACDVLHLTVAVKAFM
jgi:hypothetical protein